MTLIYLQIHYLKAIMCIRTSYHWFTNHSQQLHERLLLTPLKFQKRLVQLNYHLHLITGMMMFVLLIKSLLTLKKKSQKTLNLMLVIMILTGLAFLQKMKLGMKSAMFLKVKMFMETSILKHLRMDIKQQLLNIVRNHAKLQRLLVKVLAEKTLVHLYESKALFQLPELSLFHGQLQA